MGVIMDALNRRSPAEAAQYVLDHMASMVEPIQVIALRHVVERLLAEVVTVDGAQERLRAGCQAWGPGSGYVHISELDLATLTAERDELREEVRGLKGVNVLIGQKSNGLQDTVEVLAARLAQAERVVEAARAWRPLHGSQHEQCRPERCGQLTCALTRAVDALDSMTRPDKEN